MTQAAYLSGRMQQLQQAQPWMDPQANLTLASSAESTNSILSMAEGFRQSLVSARSGFSDLLSDPVLTKTVTTHLALKRYLNSTLGTWPVADEHLTDVQRNLQRMGYGKDLVADGTWDSRWNSVWSSAAHEQISAQLAGDKPGSISAHTATHHFLSGALPKHAFNAVVGMVKSIPHDVRDVLADTVGGVKGDVASLGSLFTGHSPVKAMKHGVEVGDRAGAQIERSLGSDVTDEQYTHQQGLGRLVNDVGTIFLAQSALKAGSAVALAAGEGLRGGSDLTLTQALSGPGVVSNLLRPTVQQVRGPGVIARSTLGGRTAEQIGRGVTERGGLVNSRAVQHIPILGRVGPVIGKLADADGVYYKTRTLLASPYRVPAIHVSGQALTRGVGLGIAARSTAAVSSALSGEQDRSSLAAGVQGEHSQVIDHVDDAVHAATSGISGGRFSAGIDSLMWVLPGVNAGTRLAGHGEAWLTGVNTALGDVGALGSLERATGKNQAELEKMAGGRENLTVWLRDKVFQAAADHHAERTLTLRDDVPTGPDKVLELQRLGHEALHNDDLLLQATREVLADPHEFEMRLRAQIANSNAMPDKWLRQDLEHYLDAGSIVRDRILGVPEHAKVLITPHSMHAFTEAKSDADFSEAIGLKNRPDQPTLTSAWLGGNNPDLVPGSVGVARLTTLSKQEALKVIDGFKAELEQAHAIPNVHEQLAAEAELVTRMADFAHTEFRLNSHQLRGLFGQAGKTDADTLAAILEDHAEQLATEVHIPGDAPSALHAAVKDLNDRGYKLVFGTDIGHIFRNDLPPVDVMTGAVTRARKVVSKLGLNPERFTDLQIGSAASIDVLTELQKVLDRARPGEVPPGYDARSLVRDLHNHDLLHPGPHDIGGIKGAAWGAVAPARKRTVEFTAAQQGKTVEEVEKELRSDVMGYMSLRDLPEKKIVEVLTRTHDVPWTTEVALRGGDDGLEVPLMSEQMARRLAKAVRVGYTKRPSYMIGAAKLEDIARGGVGPLGKSTRDHTLLRRIDAAPNRYVQLRNWYRFQLSPMFSARRLVKTNFKAGLEGVPWVAAPLKAMQQKGDAGEAFAVLDRIYPENKVRNEWMDEADRQLRSADILGLFNPRHFEAHAALEWSRQGKDDEQIRALIQKTFHYGGSSAEGRTAAERTANVVFFPYSFSKTLYRNLGGYLLDHPTQALLIASGLEAYRDFSTNHQDAPFASKWLEEHLPVLKEMERLNAFSHGISPGELGGINAPLIKSAGGALLNFFMPQKWDVNTDTGKNIKRMIPAYTDYARVQKELTEQGRITTTAIGNSLTRADDLISGHQRNTLDPLKPAMTASGQRTHAYRMLFDLEDAYRPVLDYNAGHTSADDKYTFPDNPALPVGLRGAPINRAGLKEIVHRFYPAYDPTKDTLFAIERQARIATWLDQHPNDNYRQFADLAKQVESYKNRDSYDPQQLAVITDQFRAAAVRFSSQDSAFRHFYSKNFTGTFGPIERLTGSSR